MNVSSISKGSARIASRKWPSLAIQPSRQKIPSTLSESARDCLDRSSLGISLSRSFTRHSQAQIRSLATQSSPPSSFTSSTLSQNQDQDQVQAQDVDAVIVGAGVVGLALACSMTASPTLSSRPPSQPFRMVIVDSSSLSRTREWGRQKRALAAEQSSKENQDWENRVISLSEENLQWLREIGVYNHLILSRLRPVHSMKVWDGLSGAEINFDSETNSTIFPSSATSPIGGEPLSTMIELNNLQQAMLSFLDSQKLKSSSSTRVEILEEKSVQQILPGSPEAAGKVERDPWPLVYLSSSAKTESSISAASSTPLRARLLIGADGKNSPVRSYARIGTFGWSYDRKGLVGTMRCEELNPFLSGAEEQGHTAWQRFLPTGPIAFLPLSSTTGSLVWTLPPRIAQALTILHRETSAFQPLGKDNGRPPVAQPLAQMINAAYRLPWQEIEELLEKICRLAESDTSSNSMSRDWSFISNELSSAYFRNGLSSPTGSVNGPSSFQAGWEEAESNSPQQHPPAVLSLDSRSVASFPLQLSHADAYLGSSLNAHMESNLPIAPSRILDRGLTLLGLKSPTSAPEGEEESLPGRGRTVLVGDAAHTIHPLAGQGLNLGLADAKSLCKTLEEASKNGADLGAHHSLTAYARDRYLKNQVILSAADHLHWIYKYGSRRRRLEGEKAGMREEVEDRLRDLWVWGRSTAVEVLNELEPVKKAMMQSAGSGKRRM